jgi:Tfp pilus assembly protein FimT
VPGFIQWRADAQLSYAAQDVYANLQKAKVEAARRNAYCTIIFNGNSFAVFIDSNQNFSIDGGEAVIKSINLSDYPGVRLDSSQGGGDGLTFVSPGNGLAFAPNGFPMDSTNSITSGTVFLKNNANDQASIDISPAGNVRIN